MKKTYTILLSLFVLVALSSCQKTYNCVCTDTNGVKTEQNVLATSKTQARSNCDEHGIKGNCQIQ